MRSFILSTFLIVNAAGRIGNLDENREIVSEEEVQPRRKMSVVVINGIAKALCMAVTIALPPPFGGLINPACNMISNTLAVPLHKLIELIFQGVVAEVLNILKEEGVITQDIANHANQFARSHAISDNLDLLAPDAVGVFQQGLNGLETRPDQQKPPTPLDILDVATQVAQSQEANNLGHNSLNALENLFRLR